MTRTISTIVNRLVQPFETDAAAARAAGRARRSVLRDERISPRDRAEILARLDASAL